MTLPSDFASQNRLTYCTCIIRHCWTVISQLLPIFIAHKEGVPVFTAARFNRLLSGHKGRPFPSVLHNGRTSIHHHGGLLGRLQSAHGVAVSGDGSIDFWMATKTAILSSPGDTPTFFWLTTGVAHLVSSSRGAPASSAATTGVSPFISIFLIDGPASSAVRSRLATFRAHCGGRPGRSQRGHRGSFLHYCFLSWSLSPNPQDQKYYLEMSSGNAVPVA